MTTIKGPTLHEGQLRVVELIKGPAKYITVVAPRQVGKTFLSLNAILYWSINEPGSTIFFCSPTYQQAKKPMEELYDAIQASGIVKSYNRSDFRIELKNGSVIHFKSTERADNLRGFTGTHMIVDESAYHQDGVWDSVLKPIMLVKGKKVLFISTPRGSNWFKTMYDLGQDPEQPNYASCRMHYTENPYLDGAELEEAKRTLPDHIFQAEYEGTFTESGKGVFKLDIIKDYPTWPKPIGKVYCGIDWGRANDWTCATFIDSTGKVVEIYRANKQDWTLMISEILKIVKKWNATVLAEQNSIGDVTVELLKKQWQDTHPFVTTNKSKNEIIEALQVDFANADVQLPSQDLFEPLWFELSVFEYDYSPKTRTIRYNAREPFHDDTIMSLAIANYCRKTKQSVGSYSYMARKI